MSTPQRNTLDPCVGRLVSYLFVPFYLLRGGIPEVQLRDLRSEAVKHERSTRTLLDIRNHPSPSSEGPSLVGGDTDPPIPFRLS